MTGELAIFDCDGVLIDSEPLINRAHAETLAACGFAITENALLERFCGLSDKDMLAAIEREHGRALPADYADRAATAVALAYAAKLVRIVGIEAVLAALPMPFCVASSGVLAQVRHGLELTGLAHYFGERIFSATMVARGKPAPDLFLYAAAQMGAAPRDCIVIEDSEPGIVAAVAARMTAIGFTGGSHCRPGHADRLMAAGAARVAGRMADLIPLLTGSKPDLGDAGGD
jgi:HAD superfamily hydrolase (TIGR01509 family)